MMSLMEIKDVSFSYDGVNNVFENVSFSIEKGDVLSILGPNGTGKTTLIKCLNGLLKLRSGDILLNGSSIHSIGVKEKSRRIGYIPQAHHPAFPFRVLDVVLMGREPYMDLFSSPSRNDVEKAESALDSIGISHLSDKPYTDISGGERQLVFIARVLAQEPEVLILDEPTSHLDFGNQLRTLAIVKKLAKSGLSVIMSTHTPDHAFISSNKAAIMKDRIMICSGLPDDVITEGNMKSAYGVPVKILDAGYRKTCIPSNDPELIFS